MRFWLFVLGALLAPSASMAGCGDDADPCLMPDGEYHIALPSAGAQGAPVVMFLHGAGGQGGFTIRNRSLVAPLLARGYAVIAPTGGRASFQGGTGKSWNFFPGWEGRDEAAFLSRVANDATVRFGVDGGRVLLSGFSAGAFMVTYLACQSPDRFTAYAPVAGGFWRALPKTCAGPVHLLQTHGWADRTVPLEGRRLGGGRFEQGDIFAGLELWRITNGCDGHDPTSAASDGFWRRQWRDCAAGSALELVLFPGGHTVPKGWADLALDWFEEQQG